MLAHQNDMFSLRFGTPTFRKRSTRVEPEVQKMSGVTEEERGLATCSYCGSISVEDMLRLMATSGVTYSGSDWKYGWPHKFYIEVPCEPYKAVSSVSSVGGKITEVTTYMKSKEHYKFYSTHLHDATFEQLKEWNLVCAPLLGIEFQLTDGKLRFHAPNGGYQSHGVVP